MGGFDYNPYDYMDEEELFLYNQEMEAWAWHDYIEAQEDRKNCESEEEFRCEDYRDELYENYEFFDIHYYELYDEQNDIVYYENNNENSNEKRIEETE